MFMNFKAFFWRTAFVCAVLVPGTLSGLAAQTTPAAETEIATFAGGCFWCVEEAFDKVKGVQQTTSGYIGGRTRNPTYEQVSSGNTGHAEAVQVVYDPTQVSYAALLDTFWNNIDPTQANGQFCDHGSQYRSEIYYHNEEQRRAAEMSKAKLIKGKPFPGTIVTMITASSEFYPAEFYHQDFHRKSPIRYKFYKSGCGREARLKELWGRH